MLDCEEAANLNLCFGIAQIRSGLQSGLLERLL
jgi:hypothetical protein